MHPRAQCSSTFRGSQGYWLNYTVQGPQFEETETQIFLNRTLNHIKLLRRKVKTVSLKSLSIAQTCPPTRKERAKRSFTFFDRLVGGLAVRPVQASASFLFQHSARQPAVQARATDASEEKLLSPRGTHMVP